MITPTLQSTVAQLVLDRPSRSRLFHRLGIDFCCGGKISLEEAARRKELDPQTVLTMLLAIDEAGTAQDADTTDYSSLTLSQLCDHIEQTHHAFLRTELPRLHAMLQKVARGHGERHPHMVEVLAVFEAFVEELVQHMVSEEQIVFPLICRLESGERTRALEKLERVIAQMEEEHDGAGAALRKMRALTGGYVPPAKACTTFRAALDALAELERDMHKHVHKENNILFPRALEIERQTLEPVS